MAQDFCESNRFNTGAPTCPPVPGKPVVLAFAKKQVKFADNDINNLQTFFEDACWADNFSERVLPISGVAQVDANNTDPEMGTLTGFGYQEKLTDGMLANTYHIPFDDCTAKNLMKLNGYRGTVFIFTDNGVLRCAKSGNAYTGIPIKDITVSVTGITKDGASVQVVKILITYGSDVQVVDVMTAVSYDFDAMDVLRGIESLTLNKVDNLTYQVVTECGNANLFDSYHTQLASPQLWKVTNMATGVDESVVDVAEDAVKKAFVLTVQGLATPHRINVQLAPISVLKAVGIEGFEQPKPFIDR